jgi:gliding motility-associated-like protein
VNNLLAGTYTVTITDAAGCEITRAIIVEQPDQIQNDFTISSVLCYGETNGIITPITSGGTPTGGTPSYIYDWGGINPLAVSSGTYNVTITDANGCSITDIAIVEEPNPLTLSLEPTYNYGVDVDGKPYAISCNGANDGKIEAVVNGGLAPYTYAWSNGDNTATASGLALGSISCTVTDANGCPVSNSITLTEPSVIIDNGDKNTNSYGYEVSCFGASDGEINLNPTGGVPFSNGLYSYTWTSPNGFSSTSKDIYDLTAGEYTVDIEDANGCSYSFTYTLISPLEVFNATVSTLNYAGPAHPPVNITFSDATTDNLGNPISVNHYWYWSIDRDSVSFLNSGFDTFNHEFKEVGPNLVYVVVENASTGCKDDTSFIIQVQGIDFITNVFSPNGDGINDEFVFDETGIKVLSVEIYNRWGSIVMNWTDLDKGWDGRGSDGQKLPEAVYFYVLSGEGEDGYYYENKGTITLRR